MSIGKSLIKPRYMMPLMFGIIIGFTLSLFCAPFYDCDQYFPDAKYKLLNYKKISTDIDEFEPRINLADKPKNPSKPIKKIVRPRYLATELGIRKRLFVGILASDRRLSILAPLLNKSLSSYANKLIFFVNNPQMNENMLLDSTPPGISVVSFNDDHDSLLPFHTLKYIQDNYLTQYDWFFLISDNAFIRGAKLRDAVDHISISQDLYMGFASADKYSLYCNIESGILFSYTVMEKMKQEMEWCTRNSFSVDATENIGRCVLHSSNLKCTQTAKGFTLNFHLDSKFDLETDLSNLVKSTHFNKSITVSTVKEIQTMNQLQIYFNKVDMDEIQSEIERIEDDILETVCMTPEGCNSLVWPLGVPEPYKPLNRHEVIRWDYFNSSHVFFLTDFDVVNEMTDIWKLDVDEVISFAMSKLNADSNKPRLQLVRLIQGYRQFDPSRGASYQLDLEVAIDYNQNKRTQHRRVNVMRPLGLSEILPMPYATESPTITMVVPYLIEEDLTSFINSYEQYILRQEEVADKINLYLVIMTQIGVNVDFKDLDTMVDKLNEKYIILSSGKSKILKGHLELKKKDKFFDESYRQMELAEYITGRLPAEALVFLASPCVELESEFLNRVRLNTIRGRQVFFPIPFSEYSPSIVYPSNQPQPSSIVINKNVGYFNTASFTFASFYNADLTSVLNEQNKSSYRDLYELFSRHKEFHILRATDQAFRCRWQIIEHCYEQPMEMREECKMQRDLGLGTKGQLASFFINNYNQLFKT